MKRFLLLLAICGLATALLQKRSIESEYDNTRNKQVGTVTSKKEHVAARTITAPPTYTGIINIVSSEDLNTKVTEAGDKLVLIFVTNKWCYYSRKVVPTVEDIAAMKDGHNKKKVVVLKVVSDDMHNEVTDWKYGVNKMSGWPTFIFVKNGTKVEEFIGANASRRLRKTVTRLTTRLHSENEDQE